MKHFTSFFILAFCLFSVPSSYAAWYDSCGLIRNSYLKMSSSASRLDFIFCQPWEDLGKRAQSVEVRISPNISSSGTSYSFRLYCQKTLPQSRGKYKSSVAGQQLSAPLKKGHKYYLHYCGYCMKTGGGLGKLHAVFFNTADASFRTLRNMRGSGNWAADYEALFNKEKISNINFASTADTGKWICKDLCFTATKDWDYLAFYNENDTIKNGNLHTCIDNIGLYEVKPDAGKDTVVCVKPNSSFTYTFGKPACSGVISQTLAYAIDPVGFGPSWNNISSLPYSYTFNNILSTPGTYTETHTVLVSRYLYNGSYGCDDWDTVKITFKRKPEVLLPHDTTICSPPNSYTLNPAVNPPSIFYKYKWNTGDTTMSIVTSKSGRFKITLTDTNGCYDTASQRVTLRPQIRLPLDTTVCHDALVRGVKLSVKSGYVEYKWRKGSSTSVVLGTHDTFTVFTPGRYWIYVKDSAGCYKHDSLHVYENNPVFSLGPDDTACESYVLCAPLQKFPNFHFRWQKKVGGTWTTTSTTDTCITITDSGINHIRLTIYSLPDSCTYTDSIIIVIKKPKKMLCNIIGPVCPTVAIPLKSVCNPMPASVVFKNNSAKGNYTGLYKNGNDWYFDATIGAGTYNLSYQYTDSASGCPVKGSFKAIVDSLPMVEIKCDTFCKSNTPQQLTGTPAGGTWGGTSHVTSGGMFTPNVPGTYKVWYRYTDSAGCTNTDTCDIVVGGVISQLISHFNGPGNLNCFPRKSLTLEVNLLPPAKLINVHFNWLHNGSNAQTATINTNGNYKVVVTDLFYGCTDTLDTTISIPNCCNAPATLKDTILKNVTLPPGDYVLTGDMVIEGVVTMDMVNIFMKHCPKITVIRGSDLFLTNSHLGFCPWQGIEVHGNIDACSNNRDTCAQGYMYIFKTVIDYAEIGVFVGARDVRLIDTNSGCGIYNTSADRREMGGGIVDIYNDSFKYNNADIVFSEYNVSAFCNCRSDSTASRNTFSQIEHNYFGDISYDTNRCYNYDSKRLDTFLTDLKRIYCPNCLATLSGTTDWCYCPHILDCSLNTCIWSSNFCPLCTQCFDRNVTNASHNPTPPPTPDFNIFRNNIYHNPTCPSPNVSTPVYK